MSAQRRSLLKASLGYAGLAGSNSLLASTKSYSAPTIDAFTSPDMNEAVQLLLGDDAGVQSNKLVIDAPDFIKRPGIIEVTVSTGLPNVDTIAIFVRENMLPMAALYTLPAGTEPYITSRIDIFQSTEVIAVARSKAKLYANSRNIIITANPSRSFNTLDEESEEL